MSSRPEPRFPAPWQIEFTGYRPEDERRRESLFGVGNGVLFVRACAAEVARENAERYPGAYHAGCYDQRVAQADAVTFAHDSLVNLPNWAVLRFRSEGDEQWFAPESCTILEYRQRLDLVCGVTERMMLVRDGRDHVTRLREERLVSMARPAIAALRLEIAPVNWSGAVERVTGMLPSHQ